MTDEWEATPGMPRRMLLPAVLLAAGVVLGLVAAPSAEHPEFSVIPGSPQDPVVPTASQDAETGGSWAAIDDGPLGERKDPAMVWTGREVLIWGGVGPGGAGLRDGAAYNPRQDRWRRIPPAPVRGRADAVTAWTGRELLVWGGASAAERRARGAAFDPRANRWRRIPAGPLRPRRDADSAWTGRQLIVWGGADGDDRPLRDGARYDPVADRWRRLPAGPLARGSSRDVEMAPIDGGVLVWSSSGRDARTVFYDPRADTWRDLWSPRFQPATHPTFLTTDGAVLSWGWSSTGDHGPLAMKFTTKPESWTTVAQPPVGPDAGRTLLGSDGVAVSWSRAGAGIWYDALDDQWHRMTTPPQPVAAGWAEQVWADDRLIVWHAEAQRGAAHRAVTWRPPSLWRTLPAQPTPLNSDVSVAWTGWQRNQQQALVWGTHDPLVADPADATGPVEAADDAAGAAVNAGAVYDPSLALWASMPPAPLSPRTDQAAVWTGSEFLVLGGRDGGGTALHSAAAYDPQSRSWRGVAPPPVTVTGAAAALAGHHVYAAGQRGDAVSLARYDPRRDEWQVVPAPPLAGPVRSITLWWTGREVWLWFIREGAARGVAWDPAAKSWRSLPALHGLMGQASITGGRRRLFVMDGAGITASLGLGTDGWRLHARGPRFGAPPALTWTGRNLVAYDPDERRLATLDPRSSGWAELRPPPVPLATTARLLSTGRHVFVFSAGHAAMLRS